MTELNLNLHQAQQEVFFDDARFKVVCSGRRFGKSYLDVVTAIASSLAYTLPIDPVSQPVILITMPTLKQARQIFFKPLCALLENKPGFHVDRSDYRIAIAGKPDILIRGFNDSAGDSLRGLKIAGLVADEVQDFKSMADMEATIFPAMADTPGSRAIFSGTPKGKGNNVLFQLHERSQTERKWKFFKRITADNPFVPRSEIRRAELMLPARLYRQEFEANFEDFPGQIASEANKDKHLVACPLSESATFYIGLDPGVVNPALVLFGIGSDRKFRVHRTFYKPTGDSFTSDDLIRIAKELQAFCGQQVKRVFIPDDRADLVKTFKQNGFEKQAVLCKRSRPSPKERAEIMNALFGCDRLLIDESETEFWDELISYHRDVDVFGQVTDKIAEGQQDHRIDAFLYGMSRLCMKHTFLLPHEILISETYED